METKSGIKTTELLALVAGLVVAVVPVVLEYLPPESRWVAILGAMLAVASYIGGRSYVKATGTKAAALVEAAAIEASRQGPTSPSSPQG